MTYLLVLMLYIGLIAGALIGVQDARQTAICDELRAIRRALEKRGDSDDLP